MLVVDEIRELYEYHRWANGRMLDAVANVGREEFVQPAGGSFGSLQATLTHMLAADWVWLERWNGRSPTGFPDWNVPTFEALRDKWTEVERDQTAFVERLESDDLYRMVAYRNLAGTAADNELWQLLRHVVNHGTYHRGQITVLLRDLGHGAAATDLVLWYRTR